MRRLMVAIVIMTICLNAQVFRNAESGILQRKIEYKQGGILLRFDFKQTERKDNDDTVLMWEYNEFLVPLDMKVEDIQELIAEHGYELAADEIEYLQGFNSLETDTYWQVETIKLWLGDRNIEYPASATKEELQVLVKNYLCE